MGARVRPDAASSQPTPAPPAGMNGPPPPAEQLPRPASDAAPPPEDQLAAAAQAVEAVLAVPSIEPERVVRVLASATSLALAAGIRGQPAAAPLLAAIRTLEADQATVERLIREGDVRALRPAARVAAAHAADLNELLRREQATLGELEVARTDRAAVESAPGLVRRLAALAGEVEAAFAVPASELPPGSIELGEDELRKLIAGTDVETLAGLLGERLPLPVTVALGGSACRPALDALRAWLERPEPEAAPLPEPRRLSVEPIDVVPDFVEVAAQALTWLASLGDASLAKWVVGGTWSQAVARMAAAVEAWSRWGPYGDASLAVEMDPRPRLDLVGDEEVAVVSHTAVLRPAAVAPAEEPGEPGEAGTADSSGPNAAATAARRRPPRAAAAEPAPLRDASPNEVPAK